MHDFNDEMSGRFNGWNYPQEQAKKLAATPFTWLDPATIPPRRWLFGYWLLRGEITAGIAPGGVGKSTFWVAVGLSLASGREFMRKPLHEGACSVWIWNLEDSSDEMTRQITACAMRHNISPEDCRNRLYVDSGLDNSLCTASETATGVQINEPVYAALKSEIAARGIDVLIVDPFVSSHEISENDNSQIDKVAKRWKKLATEANCAIVLVHHTRKMNGREVTAEASRGAKSLTDAARSTLVFNPMTDAEAEAFGISEKSEQRRLVRVGDDKPNRAPPEKAWWFRKDSVELGNGDDVHQGDNIGVAVPWNAPDPFEGLSTADLYAVQIEIDRGDFADNSQSENWAGNIVAQTLSMDPQRDKAKIKSLLKTWKANGALKVERRSTPRGRDRPFVIVGKWVNPANLSTLKSGVGRGGESGDADLPETHPTPPSLEGGGGGGVLGANINSEVGMNDL